MNTFAYWLDQYDKQGMGKGFKDSATTIYDRPGIRADWAMKMAQAEGPRPPDVYDLMQQANAQKIARDINAPRPEMNALRMFLPAQPETQPFEAPVGAVSAAGGSGMSAAPQRGDPEMRNAILQMMMRAKPDFFAGESRYAPQPYIPPQWGAR